MQILTFPENQPQASALASHCRSALDTVAIHRFPDGESRVRLPAELPERVVLYRSLDRPNEKLVELILAAETARRLGARDLILVAPYLCYMRQDKAFTPGEAISQGIVGRMLAQYFDGLITVDAHLHRVSALRQVVPLERALNLSAAERIGGHLRALGPELTLVGPDRESEQWVAATARVCGAEYVVGRKQRRGDRDVSIQFPRLDLQGRHAVLLDDIASSGRTLAQAAQALREAGCARLDLVVTHALFMEDAEAVIRAAGVDHLWSTDSVPHATNYIELAPLLAEGLGRLTD